MSDGKVDIPAGMILAAARALADEDNRGFAFDDNDEDDPTWAATRAAYRLAAGRVLAAAFAECRVDEEFAATFDGEPFEWTDTLEAAKLHALIWPDPDNPVVIGFQRRLKITTPPVVVTPAQEGA